jgi:hypothetical protein
MEIALTRWSAAGVGATLGVVAAAAIPAGCGGGKTSSGTTATSSAQTLKQWEVRVTGSTAARAPDGSFMERLARLLGWPEVAEASAGVPGCTVSAPGPGGTVSALTDANGKAILVNVFTPGTASVACPGTSPLRIPINGPPGAIVEVEVEVEHGALKVTAETEDPSPSEPSVSEPSPSVPRKRKGSNSGQG